MPVTDPLATPADPPHDAAPPSRLIQIIVLLTLAVAIAMVALIYVQWLNHSEPSSVLIVEADAAAAGVVVNIARLRADGRPLQPVQIELSEQNNYTASYFLEAGLYDVTPMRGDQVFAQFPTIRLLENRAYKASLVGRVPATAPAVAPKGGNPGRALP
jgi:hypothetical protein